MIQIVALIEIKDEVAFKAFEHKAVKIMAKHGGSLLSAFRADPDQSSDNAVGEIHYLQFPSIEAFKAYRSDQKLQTMAELRNQAISNMNIYVSKSFVSYS